MNDDQLIRLGRTRLPLPMAVFILLFGIAMAGGGAVVLLVMLISAKITVWMMVPVPVILPGVLLMYAGIKAMKSGSFSETIIDSRARTVSFVSGGTSLAAIPFSAVRLIKGISFKQGREARRFFFYAMTENDGYYFLGEKLKETEYAAVADALSIARIPFEDAAGLHLSSEGEALSGGAFAAEKRNLPEQIIEGAVRFFRIAPKVSRGGTALGALLLIFVAVLNVLIFSLSLAGASSISFTAALFFFAVFDGIILFVLLFSRRVVLISESGAELSVRLEFLFSLVKIPLAVPSSLVRDIRVIRSFDERFRVSVLFQEPLPEKLQGKINLLHIFSGAAAGKPIEGKELFLANSLGSSDRFLPGDLYELAGILKKNYVK